MALDRYNRPRVRHYDRPVRERDLGIFFLIFLFFFFFFFSFFSVPTGRFIGRTLPNSTGLFSSVYITFIVFFVIFFCNFFLLLFHLVTGLLAGSSHLAITCAPWPRCEGAAGRATPMKKNSCCDRIVRASKKKKNK